MQSHFSAIFQTFCVFDTDYQKYPIVQISSKKKIINDTESINIWIIADQAYHFTDFLKHYVIMTS